MGKHKLRKLNPCEVCGGAWFYVNRWGLVYCRDCDTEFELVEDDDGA